MNLTPIIYLGPETDTVINGRQMNFDEPYLDDSNNTEGFKIDWLVSCLCTLTEVLVFVIVSSQDERSILGP